MRIQHNIPAMSAYRNYSNNISALSKNLEKLSSGYKINRAGDDAAGLAISEKMRAQITGLQQAQANAKSGINLVRTAEGALTEVHDMLNRMVKLADQSANGTYDNDVDRVQLQKEVAQLQSEIDRIADSANFNGIKLLDGSMAAADAVAASTTTKTSLVSGLDRIINTVMGEGEKAYEVAGKKTILDSTTVASKAVKASVVIDLGTLGLSARGTKGSATITFDLTISGTKIQVTATGITKNAKATAIAKKMAAALASAVKKGNVGADVRGAASQTVKINGLDWKVKASGTKLVFTQAVEPKTKEEAEANFDVKIGFDEASADQLNIKNGVQGNAGGQAVEVQISGSINSGVYVKTKGVSLDDVNKANTVFNIKKEDIQDGTQIAIGNKVILLKVGADSTVATSDYKGNGSVVLVTLNENDDLNTALCKISNKVGSTVTLYRMGGSKGTTLQSITFKLGVSNGKDGNVVGLTLQRVTKISGASGVATNAFLSVEELAKNFKMKVKETTKTEAKEATNGLTLQIGDTSEDFNRLSVSIKDMHCKALGIGDVDISTQEGAAEAVQKIKDAINTVSDVRGTLGATQNRLDHTINNLSVMTENIQDAESTIRDTDVADEMMAYTKNNILVQSAQAMLAQANQLPQGVLQLLQ